MRCFMPTASVRFRRRVSTPPSGSCMPSAPAAAKVTTFPSWYADAMRVIVSYDVATRDAAGRSRLRRIAKTCKGFGVRVQYSVFECSVGDREWVLFRDALLRVMDPELDSL